MRVLADPDPLVRLMALDRFVGAVERAQLKAIEDARAAGHTWQRISEAVPSWSTRQGAHAAWSRLTERRRAELAQLQRLNELVEFEDDAL